MWLAPITQRTEPEILALGTGELRRGTLVHSDLGESCETVPECVPAAQLNFPTFFFFPFFSLQGSSLITLLIA
jgi:hypothetical protein